MTPDPITVNAETSFCVAVSKLLLNKFNSLPVVGEGGMVTGEERFRENLADLYGSVNGYDGRPTQMEIDRTEAIATAFAHAQPEDTVVLAGKGHEQSIFIGREKRPWDDRRVARELLRKR